MSSTRTRKFVMTTIAEPFPVFYRPGVTDRDGPFYAAGSQTFDLVENEEFRRWCAEALRLDGYTVTVEIVDR